MTTRISLERGGKSVLGLWFAACATGASRVRDVWARFPASVIEPDGDTAPESGADADEGISR